MSDYKYNSEKLPEDENLLFWLSLDEEGCEWVKERNGSNFLKQQQEQISKDRKVENLIANILGEEEKCPDYITKRILERIQTNVVPLNDNEQKGCKVITRKNVLIFGIALAAVLVMCISVGLLSGFLVPTSVVDNNFSKDYSSKGSVVESDDLALEKKRITLNDVMHATFERNLSNSDSESIENIINAKVNTITINLRDFLNANADYQLVSYVEDELDGDSIFQLIFDYKGDIVKAIVLPSSEIGIGLVKQALEEGTFYNVKRIDNYFISVVGNPSESEEFLQYITVRKETPSHVDANGNVVVTNISSLIEIKESSVEGTANHMDEDGKEGSASGSETVEENLPVASPPATSYPSSI